MKIQTNQGERELTAEMVVKGMVFRHKHGHGAIASDVPIRADWFDAMGPDWTLSGCNPEIATRADCERFGVHGDAGAHGFARLRGGGAVDLQQEALPVGSVTDSAGCRLTLTRYDPTSPLLEGERFVGLNARYAHPEDVRRLCCGAEHLSNEQYDPHRCTLAIGDHDHHEDLATGVRWTDTKAVPTTPPSVEEARIVFMAEDDNGTLYDVASLTRDVYACACGTNDPEEHAESCAAPWWIQQAGAFAWAAIPQGIEKAIAMGQKAGVGACALGLFVWLRRLWDATPEGLLSARDAAVSQAIADVPEGCDPKGWTRVVHVLGAYHEETVRTRGRARATADMVRHIEAARPVVTAYARARFVAGYGVKEALAMVPTPTDTVARMCAAYEAGR